MDRCARIVMGLELLHSWRAVVRATFPFIIHLSDFLLLLLLLFATCRAARIRLRVSLLNVSTSGCTNLPVALTAVPRTEWIFVPQTTTWTEILSVELALPPRGLSNLDY